MKRKHRYKETSGVLSSKQLGISDKDGRTVVNMNVSDDSNFLSVFSVSSDPVISSEVADFMEFSTQLLPPGTDITLRIYSSCIDEDEQKIYTAAMKEFYQEKYTVIAKEWKRNNIATAILAAVGILCLLFMFAFEHIFHSAVWNEVIDIMAWVFLWEAVDIYFFRNKKLKDERKRTASFMDMNIEYYHSEDK